MHEEVVEHIIGFAGENGFTALALDYSPVKGPEGNIEYLLYLRKCDGTVAGEPGRTDAHAVVEASHKELDV